MNFPIPHNFNNLKLEDINQEIIKLKQEILELKIKKATQQTIKSHTFKQKKHLLAQLLTLETQKRLP